MNIQWYPGHMAKTRRLLSENLKLVDIVVELLDARVPVSSKNPVIDSITASKPKIIALNKSDLADPLINRQWIEYFKDNDIQAILINSINGKGIEMLKKTILMQMKEKLNKYKEKGYKQKAIKALVVGIPNVGKSALINRVAGKYKAITGNKPGVTKTKQWVRLDKDIYLMDTPGVLWPKFEDKNVGLNLAFTGAIKDEIMDITELSQSLIAVLMSEYTKELSERYKLDSTNGRTPFEILGDIGKKRGCLLKGGDIDLYRTANIVIDEFRAGKMGKFSLEKPTGVLK